MEKLEGHGRVGWCARRPLVAAAACFVFGILLHRWAPGGAWPFLWMAGLMLMAATAGGAWRGAGCAGVALAIVAAGIAAGKLEGFFYAADEIGLFTREEPRLARIEMVIEEPPRVIEGEGRLPSRQAAWGRAARVLTQSGWENASGGLLLRVDEIAPDLAAGQRVEVFGLLARPRPAMNPGEADWQEYYRTERILATIRVAHRESVRILEAHHTPWLVALRMKARGLLSVGFSKEQSLDHALLRALVLGDHDPQLRDVQEEFRRTGTSHHLAISGMHVAVLGALVFGACRCLLISPRPAAIIGIGFVIIYGLAAMPSAPVIRSVLLCATFALGVLWRRAVDGVQLLAAVVIVMLVSRPLDLYDAGFALSFGTVLGLMALTRPLVEWMETWRDRDVVIAQSVTRPTALGAIGRWARWKGVRMIAGAGVAWAVASPLVALHFEQFNPWSIPASLLMAIPVFLALIAGILKIVLTLIIPGLAESWAGLAGLSVKLMRESVELLGALPGSDWPVGQVGPWMVVAIYALLALPLLPWRWLRMRQLIWAGPATACAAIIIAPLLGAGEQIDAGRLKVTLLAVGAGQCAVVHLPSGRSILIDAGSSSIADLWRTTLNPYLRRTGSRLDAAIVSHANYDHYSAVGEALEAGALERVYLGTRFENEAGASARAMLDSVREVGQLVTRLGAGARVELDGETSIDVLWPGDAAMAKANDSSLVLRLNFKGKSILFTGDIQAAAQRDLMMRPEALGANVLIAPHHGSSEETTERFVRAVNPEIILSSNDATLSQKQREFERLAGGRNVLRTHQCGAISVTIDQNGKMNVQTFRPMR